MTDWELAERYSDPIATLVIQPWIEFGPQFEFRIFIHANRIIGVSQQSWYVRYDWSRARIDFDFFNSEMPRVRLKMRVRLLYVGRRVFETDIYNRRNQSSVYRTRVGIGVIRLGVRFPINGRGRDDRSAIRYAVR